jgi:hypothetical protein
MTIKAQTKKLLPELQQESQLKREERAAIELNPQNIRMMIFEAARAGQTARRVKIRSATRRTSSLVAGRPGPEWGADSFMPFHSKPQRLRDTLRFSA